MYLEQINKWLNIASLSHIMRNAKSDVLARHLQVMLQILPNGDVTTPLRVAALLSQVAHETCELRYMKEVTTGIRYENNKALGNTNVGDGIKYCGRGPLMLTGKLNYSICGKALNLPLLEYPELLEDIEPGWRSAIWYWTDRKLNKLADIGDLRGITKAINGACTDGAPSYYTRRETYYLRAIQAFNI